MFVILGCWGIWAACTCQLWSPVHDGRLSWSKSLFSLVQFNSEDISVGWSDGGMRKTLLWESGPCWRDVSRNSADSTTSQRCATWFRSGDLQGHWRTLSQTGSWKRQLVAVKGYTWSATMHTYSVAFKWWLIGNNWLKSVPRKHSNTRTLPPLAWTSLDCWHMADWVCRFKLLAPNSGPIVSVLELKWFIRPGYVHFWCPCPSQLSVFGRQKWNPKWSSAVLATCLKARLLTTARPSLAVFHCDILKVPE